MKKISEIKESALSAIDGHWHKVIIPVLIWFGITTVVQSPSTIYRYVSGINEIGHIPSMDELVTNMCISIGVFLLALFICWPLRIGVLNAYKVLYRTGDDKLGANSLRLTYCDGKYWRNVGAQALTWLYEVLWTLLLIIPGFIKMFSYSMTPFILQDNPELGIDDAIERSIELMDGHKWKLFVLDLSFLGWFLASALTLFIGLIWLAPYVDMAHVEFYHELLEEEKESKK